MQAGFALLPGEFAQPQMGLAAGLVAAVRSGWMSAAIAHAPDVGMSYGAMAVVGVLTAAIPPRWRPAWAGYWLAVAAIALVIPALAVGGAWLTAPRHLPLVRRLAQ